MKKYLILVLLLLLFIPGVSNAKETKADIVDSAGPRKGVISIIEVQIRDRRQLDVLVKAGYNISDVRGKRIEIYATDSELAELRKLGFEITVTGTQGADESRAKPDEYHDYAQLTVDMQAFADSYPEICRLYSVGQSVEGRELWVLLITDNPEIEEDEPEFRYISTMHGDEVVGMELCLLFIDMILSEYGTNPRISSLINETSIWIMPCMNPDGLDARSRYNANGYDLNRSFPIYPGDYSQTIYDGEALGDEGRQAEVGNIMRWSAEHSFTLSANFHGGALVANYPYDDDGMGSVFSPTPDNEMFEYISRLYSMYNLPMWESTQFEDGITNGAEWYVVYGGMQDWFYRYESCNDITLEVSVIDRPSYSKIPDFWDENRESMTVYLEAVHMGVRGIITDRATGEPLYGRVWIEGNTHPVFTDPDIGDYHRMLMPGTYNLIYEAEGYAAMRIENVIVSEGTTTRIDLQLSDVDLDDNGNINFDDLSVLISRWLDTECGSCGGADLSGDSKVDTEDFAIFAENYPSS
jgi:carboxypeptidase D